MADGTKAELINGEIVMMAPASWMHNQVQAKVVFAACAESEKQKTGGGDYLKILAGSYTYYGACNAFVHDVAAFWNSEFDPEQKSPIKTTPFWVCEVLSPSNWTIDTNIVFKHLEARRVPYYWVADPKAKGIFVFKFNFSSGRYTLEKTVSNKDGAVCLEPFVETPLDLEALFH